MPKSSRNVAECLTSAEVGFGTCSRTYHQITCSAEPLLRSGVCLRYRQSQTEKDQPTSGDYYMYLGNRCLAAAVAR